MSVTTVTQRAPRADKAARELSALSTGQQTRPLWMDKCGCHAVVSNSRTRTACFREIFVNKKRYFDLFETISKLGIFQLPRLPFKTKSTVNE